jgi:hypothetical protein
MKTQEVVRRGSTAAAEVKAGPKPRPLVRCESVKSLPSTSGSLGKVSALSKKRPPQPRKKVNLSILFILFHIIIGLHRC